MNYSLILLQLEILALSIFLLYILYFFGDKIITFFKRLKLILSSPNDVAGKVITKIELNEDQNLHANTYVESKNQITDEDKVKLIDLVKKIHINIAKADYDVAKGLIIEWLTIDKFNIDINLELASIYILEKDYKKAEYVYKDLLLVHTDNFDITKKLAYVLTIQENYDLAIEMYKKAHEIDINDLEIVNMLAHLYFYKNMHLESIENLKVFLKDNPKDVDNIVLMWACYKALWMLDEALEIYQKALEIQPYNDNIKKEAQEIYDLLNANFKEETEILNDQINEREVDNENISTPQEDSYSEPHQLNK